MSWNWRSSWFGKALFCGLLTLSLAMGRQHVRAQESAEVAHAPALSLPAEAEDALREANQASFAQLAAVEQAWRDYFRETRNGKRLTGFVGESIDLVEKLRQIRDFAMKPGATEARITTLFRQRIMDADAICKWMEKSLTDYCKALDEQDAGLFISLDIDREAGRTSLSRSVIDPASFKRPINEVTSAAVSAVQNDMARTIASIVASEAISRGVKEAARDFGINQTEEGSFADFLTGVLIEIGVGVVVDAVSDPTKSMVSDLDARLQTAERAILDGTADSPGFVTTLRRITNERVAARRKLVEAELLK